MKAIIISVPLNVLTNATLKGSQNLVKQKQILDTERWCDHQTIHHDSAWILLRAARGTIVKLCHLGQEVICVIKHDFSVCLYASDMLGL